MCFVPYEGNSGRFISVPYASCTSVIPDEGLGSIYRVFFFTCPSEGSLKVLISIYPYLEKTPNFSRFYQGSQRRGYYVF